MKDFFISYTGSDEKYATWVAETLEKNGYVTTIQAWDFRPGDNFVSKINESLKECKKLVVILSENYLKSKWCEAEWTVKLAEQIQLNERRIIPVRIEPVELKGLLSPIVYIDIFDKSDEDMKTAILEGIKETVERVSDGAPSYYNIEHIQIDNDYYVRGTEIIYQKTCRSRVLVGSGPQGEVRKLHNRITWFADEKITLESMTEGVTIEYLDLKDTNLNYNVVFDHALVRGEEIEYCVRAVLTNKNQHFSNFFSVEIIAPIEQLNMHLDVVDLPIEKYCTQKVAQSPMNRRTELPKEHVFHGLAHWYIKKPELGFEYKIFW